MCVAVEKKKIRRRKQKGNNKNEKASRHGTRKADAEAEKH